MPQGLCAAYDATRVQQEQLQAQAASAVENLRQGLAQRGHAAALLKRVKLVDFRGQQLLEVRGLRETGSCTGPAHLFSRKDTIQVDVHTNQRLPYAEEAWQHHDCLAVVSMGTRPWPAAAALGSYPQVPSAVRRDLEALANVTLVKEAQTIAKYSLPGLEATLQAGWVERRVERRRIKSYCLLVSSCRSRASAVRPARELCTELRSFSAS